VDRPFACDGFLAQPRHQSSGYVRQLLRSVYSAGTKDIAIRFADHPLRSYTPASAPALLVHEKLYASIRPSAPHFSVLGAPVHAHLLLYVIGQFGSSHSAAGLLSARAAGARRLAACPQKQWLPPSMPAAVRFVS
jgi:hypothetical protein